MTYDQDEMFPTESYDDPSTRPPPINELRKLHEEGVRAFLPILGKGHDSPVVRIRDISDAAKDPQRLNEVTVRYVTPSGRRATEWMDLDGGRNIAYGWLGRESQTIHAYVILHGSGLLDAIDHRPGCLVPDPRRRSRMVHHAPGGAMFYVVNLRHIPPDIILASHGGEGWGTEPAPVVEQGELW